MFKPGKSLFVLAVFTVIVPLTANAQTFELPEARARENYRVQIEQVLRDTYRLKFKTETQNATIQWTLENGDLPLGLSVRTDGFVVGMPAVYRDQAFAFRLRAADASVKTDILILEFTMKVKAGGLRLVKFEGPTLTPIDVPGNESGSKGKEERDRNTGDAPGNGISESAPPQDGAPVLAWIAPTMPNGHTMPHYTQSQMDLGISVSAAARICMLEVKTEDENRVTVANKQKVDKNKSTQIIKVSLSKGVNKIRVVPFKNKNATGDCAPESDLAKFTGMSTAHELTLDVTCDGPDCGKAPAATAGAGSNGGNGENAQNPFSSRNRRFIVGFEQSGAASAESVGKPFLDLFLTTPLHLGKNSAEQVDEPFSRLSLWGNVKLNSTPQQIASFADISSNAISSITEGKVNKLTLGFDFVVGPELRLKKAGRTHIALIAGFGAITPLSPTQTTQIFKTPDLASSQGPRFYAKYPEARGHEYIGFTTPERDRFLRQYFAGLRFRTYQLDENKKPRNRFPGMFDVTFGQSEAVTGGVFHKFVIGLDGFYTLPFPDDSRFLYIFGSARFKAGGRKTTETPFILDTAPSSVLPTDLNVFLANPTASNRDNYRIGFGVDLIELFKFTGKKKTEAKD